MLTFFAALLLGSTVVTVAWCLAVACEGRTGSGAPAEDSLLKGD